MRRLLLSRKYLTIYASLIIFVSTAVVNLFKKTPQQTLPISPITPIVTIVASSSATLTKVIRVIDGDTIEIENGQKVRYIGIDTPEIHNPKKPIQCFGQEAYLKNKTLVEGKQIRLEKDVSDKDRYGRLLRFIFIQKESTSEAIFVNDYLVREGFAFAATFPPDVKYSQTFRLAQQEAREKNKGLWKQCK